MFLLKGRLGIEQKVGGSSHYACSGAIAVYICLPLGLSPWHLQPLTRRCAFLASMQSLAYLKLSSPVR